MTDEVDDRANPPGRRRRLLVGGIAVAVVAALIVGVTMWLARGDGEAVTIDLNDPTFDVNARSFSGKWRTTVRNQTGEKLTKAALTFTVDDPGGKLPPIEFDNETAGSLGEGECMNDDGDLEADCVKHEKHMEKQGCEVPDARDEEERFGRTLECTGDIGTGGNTYLLYPTMIDLNMDNADEFGDYPDLEITAMLTVAGKTVATATDGIAVTGAQKYQRIDFDGFPEELPSDRTGGDGVAWSFTVTNDTDEDVEGMELDVQVYYHGFIEIDSEQPGCDYPEGFDDLRAHIECGVVDIPAGESLTVDMTLYVTPDEEDLDQNCHEKNGLCKRSGVDVLVSEPDGDDVFAEAVAVTRVRPVG